MNKDVRKAMREAERIGWTFEQKRRKFIGRHRDGVRRVSISITPSDHNAVRNIRKDFCRNRNTHPKNKRGNAWRRGEFGHDEQRNRLAFQCKRDGDSRYNDFCSIRHKCRLPRSFIFNQNATVVLI